MRVICKKILAIGLSIVMISYNFLPITTVFATGSKLKIDFRVDDGDKHGKLQYKLGSGEWTDVTADITINDLDTSTNDLFVRLVPDSGYTADTEHMGYKEEENSNPPATLSNEIAGGLTGSNGYVVQSPYFDLSNIEFVEVNNNPDPGQGPNPPIIQQNFDGKAYFVWACGDSVCYHKFTGLTGEETNGGYNINYINLADVTDQSSNHKDYTWGQDNANWVLASDVENNGVLDESKMEPIMIFGDPDDEFDMGIQLNPAGAEDGENSICTNGDMNFRACIVKPEYEAVKFNNRADDYTYFPGFWDPTFFESTIDVSGTTKASPAEYDVYVLEPSITFETTSNSKSKITSVKALDVNSKAVEITKSGDKFTIKFNSNYYDAVVFELTDASGNKEYLRIARVSLYVNDNFRPNVDAAQVTAHLYYPTAQSYNDYEVVATVVNKDGTETTSVVSARKGDVNDPRLAQGIIDDYTYESGVGLHMSQYSVDVSKENTAGVYFTVIKKGALKSDNYGGTFSGSKKGTYYSLKTRKVIYE